MDLTAALALLGRITNTWDKVRWPQAKFDIWRDELESLDEGVAGTVYVRLRKTATVCPTISEFISECNATNTQDASTRPARSDCSQPESCDNSGWATIWLKDEDGREYSPGVQPCRCVWGRDRETVHQTIIGWNEAELERLAPGRTARKADEKRDAA